MLLQEKRYFCNTNTIEYIFLRRKDEEVFRRISLGLHCIEVDFAPNIAELLPRLGLEHGSEEAADFIALLEQMRSVAKPRAAFLDVDAEDIGIETGADGEADRVVVGGVVFRSRLLAENRVLSGCGRAWPHIVTCGREMYDFFLTAANPLEQYWCDEIMRAALDQAWEETLLRIDREFRPGKLASIGPGSLPEWPIQEQAPLFRLLREAAAFTGVELTDSLIMLPTKSVSGFLFPSETDRGRCAACPRENCPDRQTANLQK
jgi:hypothetical protein